MFLCLNLAAFCSISSAVINFVVFVVAVRWLLYCLIWFSGALLFLSYCLGSLVGGDAVGTTISSIDRVGAVFHRSITGMMWAMFYRAIAAYSWATAAVFNQVMLWAMFYRGTVLGCRFV